jgi:hypothetical protein
MLSVDPKQLETIQFVASIAGLVRDPTGFKAMLDSAESILGRMEDVTNKYSTVQKAQEFLHQAEVVKLQASQQLAAAEKAATAIREKASETAISRESAIAAREHTLALEANDIAARTQRCKKLEAELDTRLAALTKAQEDLAVHAKAIQEREATLARAAADIRLAATNVR